MSYTYFGQHRDLTATYQAQLAKLGPDHPLTQLALLAARHAGADTTGIQPVPGCCDHWGRPYRAWDGGPIVGNQEVYTPEHTTTHHAS